jgi:orotate phosphoribosyltransferase
MEYRSFEDLHRSIVKNLYKVPGDIDLIIGIPRSGYMAANILALHLHLPVTDIESYKKGMTISHGERLACDFKKSSGFKNILVLDDSVHRGVTIDNARINLKKLFPNKNFTFATVYMNPKSRHQADIFFELCPVPRVFEWNLMNHRYLKNACVDIDGVLCVDPTEEENDDGENYLHFIQHAKPLLRSKKKIGYLVTNRLEKYRKPTEEWLKKQNVDYDHLIMRNLPDKAARRKANNYGEFKASVYLKNTHTKLFIESSFNQARRIAELSEKMVYCVDKRIMIYPNGSLNLKKSFIKTRNKYIKKLKKSFGI